MPYFRGEMSEMYGKSCPNGRKLHSGLSLFTGSFLHKLDISLIFVYNFALVEDRIYDLTYCEKSGRNV